MNLRVIAAIAAMGLCTSAQDFDLVDINIDPLDPAHPGLTYEYVPVTAFATEGPGITVADFDNDGDDDVFLGGTEGEPNELYINAGDGTFTESAASFGVDEPTKRRSHGNFFDYDNDGDLDLITFGFPGENVVSDLYSLFKNTGSANGFLFADATASAGAFVFGAATETTTYGISGGSAVADYDNDGYLDVIATYWYRNMEGCCSGDDQFRLWHSEPNPVPDDLTPGWSPRIFVDKTLEAGLDTLGGDSWIWAPTFLDFNRDGLADLHINVEQGEDMLMLNNGDGTFAPSIGTAVGMNFNGPGPLPDGEWGHEMGFGVGDIDNDGDRDFYLTNAGATGPWATFLHKHDAFYRNDTDHSLGGVGPAFHHIGDETSVTTLTDGVGWGAAFIDLDNDGDKDLLTGRGLGSGTDPSQVGRRAENSVWRNDFPAVDGTGNVVWTDISADHPDFTRVGGVLETMRSVVGVDYDNDGDVDIIGTRTGSFPVAIDDEMAAGFFMNTATDEGNAGVYSLQVSLIEDGGSLNTVGARVYTRTGGVEGVPQVGEVIVGSSWLGQESARLHFGLADATEADYLAVRWKDNAVTVLTADLNDLKDFVTVARPDGGLGSVGDLDGDGDLDCDDLAFLSDAVLDPAGADGAQPSWPWRVTGDADGNDLIDGRDFELLRLMVGNTMCDVGAALAGVAGEPILRVQGVGSPTVDVILTGAAPNADAFLVVGLGTPYLSFKQGLLVPTPDAVLGPFPTDGLGGMALAGPWPGGVPADILIQLQVLTQDKVAPKGWSFSNGASIRTP